MKGSGLTGLFDVVCCADSDCFVLWVVSCGTLAIEAWWWFVVSIVCVRVLVYAWSCFFGFVVATNLSCRIVW